MPSSVTDRQNPSLERKFICILILATLAVFFNSLFNGFVGDDWVILIENTFYRSWHNLHYLFSNQYLTPSTYSQTAQNFHSGSVAYRPVVSMTFFLDYGIWKLNPFGFHLSNLIWHTVNAVLVYFVVKPIVKNIHVAFFAALVFSVHPVKTEAVCSIGYRSDILAAFFFLTSFLFYINAAENKKKIAFYAFSAVAYFFALFSKESAIVLPAVLIVYDVYFRNIKLQEIGKGLKGRYASFLAITVFYLYIYLKVFPNTTLGTLHLAGGNILPHIASSLWIFMQYCIMLAVPLVVNLLPPLYTPPMEPGLILKGAVSFVLFLSFVYLIFKTYRYSKTVSFFLVWFLISLAPVVNIIPIANPMAHRFLYLPSVGFLAAAAIGIETLSARWQRSSQLSHADLILKALIIGLCVVTTFPLNMRWKNDHSVARSLLENYPDNPKAYSILAMDYFRKKEFKEASTYFDKFLLVGKEDPTIHILDGLCLMNVNDLKGAEEHFQRSIELFPYAPASYNALGKIYFMRRQYDKAQQFFEASLNISPNFAAYGYLAQMYLQSERPREADAVLEKAQHTLGLKDLSDYRRMLNANGPAARFPFDIGI